jgi:hypothetical protein
METVGNVVLYDLVTVDKKFWQVTAASIQGCGLEDAIE